jgi:hypothetical protein
MNEMPHSRFRVDADRKPLLGLAARQNKRREFPAQPWMPSELRPVQGVQLYDNYSIFTRQAGKLRPKSWLP